MFWVCNIISEASCITWEDSWVHRKAFETHKVAGKTTFRCKKTWKFDFILSKGQITRVICPSLKVDFLIPFLPLYELQMASNTPKKLPTLFNWLQRCCYIPRTYHLDAFGMGKSTFSEGQITCVICPLLKMKSNFQVFLHRKVAFPATLWVSNASLCTHKASQVIQLASEILIHTQNISFGCIRDEKIDF